MYKDMENLITSDVQQGGRGVVAFHFLLEQNDRSIKGSTISISADVMMTVGQQCILT